MKRLLVFVIAFGLVGSLNAKELEVPKANYHIKLSLDMPKIEDVAVIHALIDFDPLTNFKSSILKEEKRKRSDKEYAEFYKKLNIPVGIEVAGHWDRSIFGEVKADSVYILEQKKVSSRHSHSMSGDIKDKKVWIVTKATVYGKTPFVWAIPLDIKSDFKADVVLNKKNAINLVDLYNPIVSEAAKK